MTPRHFHPLHRHLDISQAIIADSSPLQIASSRTQTGNLWLSSASHEPLDFFERNIFCNFDKSLINCNILSTLKFIPKKVNLNYWLYYNNLIKFDTPFLQNTSERLLLTVSSWGSQYKTIKQKRNSNVKNVRNSPP